MRRVRAGKAARRAEWMAPDQVVHEVRQNFLESVTWLHESGLPIFEPQWASPQYFLTGEALRRHDMLLTQYLADRIHKFAAVLRMHHQVLVRRFSKDGRRCLVVDYQTERRMATYDVRKQTRLHTQDLGSGVVVYRMAYHARDQRWKIESLVQELPAAWGKRSAPRLEEVQFMPPAGGRDC
ncbi:MAG TPA: hypothetical protein VER79_12790 [Candidatus Limnocylindrales bacterium]|nr:hypothetical protein [Candidatus Limnocylindrales bacterium]